MNASKIRISVALLSTCPFDIGGKSSLNEIALADAVSAGISIFAAAGNGNVDAGKTYPCVYNTVSCIGAIDKKLPQMDWI